MAAKENTVPWNVFYSTETKAYTIFLSLRAPNSWYRSAFRARDLNSHCTLTLAIADVAWSSTNTALIPSESFLLIIISPLRIAFALSALPAKIASIGLKRGYNTTYFSPFLRRRPRRLRRTIERSELTINTLLRDVVSLAYNEPSLKQLKDLN